MTILKCLICLYHILYCRRDDISGMSMAMTSKLKDLVRRFSIRTERAKEMAIQPPTPSTDGEEGKSGEFWKNCEIYGKQLGCLIDG